MQPIANHRNVECMGVHAPHAADQSYDQKTVHPFTGGREIA